jgi:hypothetical protein
LFFKVFKLENRWMRSDYLKQPGTTEFQVVEEKVVRQFY